jgi:hypothetical protein
MSCRDANANDMLDMIGLRRHAFLDPPKRAEPLLAIDPGVTQCEVAGPATIPPPWSITGRGRHTPTG